MNIINKKARRDYQILATYEAGIQLTGPEVKSIRDGKVSLEGAHVQIGIGRASDSASRTSLEARLVGLHTAHYIPAGIQNVDPARPKKLLLNRDEIIHLYQYSRSKGTTLIPLKIYSKKGWIKVEIALARGQKKWQKKEAIKRKDLKRETNRELKRTQSGNI